MILVKPRALFIGLSVLCLLAIWLSLAFGAGELAIARHVARGVAADWFASWKYWCSRTRSVGIR